MRCTDPQALVKHWVDWSNYRERRLSFELVVGVGYANGSSIGTGGVHVNVGEILARHTFRKSFLNASDRAFVFDVLI